MAEPLCHPSLTSRRLIASIAATGILTTALVYFNVSSGPARTESC
jgi:hypothetical protein